MGEPDVFQFGEFTLDARERRLSRGNQALHLTPKALDVLLALVREPERLLTKDELLTQVWPNAYVAEGILTVHMSALRKALGDEGRPATYIETVPRAGYRFVAKVSRLPSQRQSTSTARFAEVHELVGRGRAHLLTGSSLALREAVAAFQSAIEIEPDHAGAHAGLALACCIRTGIRAVPHQEGYAQAKTSALRALALDPASADAQVALGTVLFLSEWAWAAAERSFRRALQINPAHTEGLLQYGTLMEALGRLDEGLALKQQALERDSPSALVFVQIAMSYWHQRRYEDTIAWANRALQVDPRHVLASECLASAYWTLGRFDAFVEETVRRAITAGQSEDAVDQVQRFGAELKRISRAGGELALACFMLQVLSKAPAQQRSPVQLAVFSGAARRMDDAFQHLDQALSSRDPALVHLAVAPQWDPMRADPRFSTLLARLGLPAGQSSH